MRQGLSISAAADKADISRQTWAKIENGPGTSFEEYVLGRVEVALGWVAGTVEAILTDRRARPLADVAAQMRAIANNPNRSEPLRRQATAVLAMIDAIRAADADEAEAAQTGSRRRTARPAS